MKHIILCEGSTDYFLLQYYMRQAYRWNDDSTIQNGILKMSGQRSRNLFKDDDVLTIMATGGCSRMGEGLKEVLRRNYLSPPDLSESYDKIILVTDHDEVGTEQNFVQMVTEIFDSNNVSCMKKVVNNTWIQCEMKNQVGVIEKFSFLLMIIPFQENGAMETFLLNAIANQDSYDEVIIQSCNQFVDNVDPQKKYLSSRRHLTKAKFDTYFSIRTPVEQFRERQNILKNVKWEDYTKLQTEFQKLGEL